MANCCKRLKLRNLPFLGRSGHFGSDRARAYIHYLQTNGIDNLKPRGDLTWTDDGIALEPYIREARRGVALKTIRHEDVAEKFFPGSARARCFEDSIGIGQYHYRMHPVEWAIGEAGGHLETLLC